MSTVKTLDRPQHLPEEFYRKVVGDAVPVTVKNEFLQECVSCSCEMIQGKSKASDQSIEEVFSNFAASRLHLGDAIALGSMEIVAHVRNLAKTADFLQSRIQVDRTDIIRYFSWLAAPTGSSVTQSQHDEAVEWFATLKATIDKGTGKEFAISAPVCWMAREISTNDAENIIKDDPACLPCRLGLPEFLNEAGQYQKGLLFIAFLVESGNVSNGRAATFCHGSYRSVRDIWEPGGTTKPIPYGPIACVSKGGIAEIVCDAPSFKSVSDKFFVFRN